MNNYKIIHTGLFLGETDGKPMVRILNGNDSDKCTGCALAFSCKPSDNSELTVAASYSTILNVKPSPGQKVRIMAESRASLKATFVLLVLPLITFLAVALCCSAVGTSDGITAAVAFFASVLFYGCTYFYYKQQYKYLWQIIDIL